MAVKEREHAAVRRRDARVERHRINDLASFERATTGARDVAGLYFYYVLGNPLIDVALEVCRDFFRRPQIFTEDGNPAVAPLIARLHTRIGSDERIPSREQRAAIFVPVFGTATDETDEGDFARLRNDLMQAAAAFAERSFDTGVGMLRERVREAHRPFKEYLTGLQGASTNWSRSEALPTVDETLAFSILRSDAVGSVYGIPIAPRPEWPYTEDANGDKLVEEISTRGAAMNGATPAITREAFINLQRTALRGAEALATIIDFDEGGSDDDLDLLITQVYSWYAARRPRWWLEPDGGDRTNGVAAQPVAALPPAMRPVASG